MNRRTFQQTAVAYKIDLKQVITKIETRLITNLQVSTLATYVDVSEGVWSGTVSFASIYLSQCPSRQLLRYIYLASSLADFCSSTVGKSHGSGVANCSVGTPSSNRRETTLEKLNINANQQSRKKKNIDKRNVLPEEQFLIIRISLGVLLERLVL